MNLTILFHLNEKNKEKKLDFSKSNQRKMNNQI